MLAAPSAILHALRRELKVALGSSVNEGSLSQSVESALRLLEVRETGGKSLANQRLGGLAHLCRTMTETISSSRASDEVAGSIATILALIDSLRAGSGFEAFESGWGDLMSRLDRLVSVLMTPDMLGAAQRTDIAKQVAAWEYDDRQSMIREASAAGSRADTNISQDKLASYLQDRLQDPSLTVTTFQPLPGGFGKETVLFDVAGEKMMGFFVMRRDYADPTLDNDCHRVRLEYPVIRAAYERGFPAPDALWLDTDHHLLPGGDFIVMRRAPGKTGGNVFRATSKLSGNMAGVLARGMAKLHNLPALLELGDHTESIRLDRWNLPLRECIRRYIKGWYDRYLIEVINPSPTLTSLFEWLFQNIPSPGGRPVLLHGDIGFHNMLIDNGELSAVVDWEFAHIGDPAEDVGYVKNTSAGMDWTHFIAEYNAAGGPLIDAARLHFFQVWGQVRNAAACNISMGKFAQGTITDLRLVYSGHYYLPLFMRAACDLIDAGPGVDVMPVAY